MPQPLIYGKDAAASGLAPVLFSPLEPLTIKTLAPAVADKTRVSRCTETRPHTGPVNGVDVEVSHTLVGSTQTPGLARCLKIILCVIFLQWELFFFYLNKEELEISWISDDTAGIVLQQLSNHFTSGCYFYMLYIWGNETLNVQHFHLP